MEWRIIVPLLCLIGIIHVPVNAVDVNNTSTNSTNSTAVYRFSLRFSINDTFLSDYSNITSNASLGLIKNITSQVDPLYKTNYTHYLSFIISKFSNGSIVTDGELQFSNGSKPNVTDLTQILKNGNISIGISTTTINITDITPPPATTAPAVTNQTVAPTTVAPAKVAKMNLLFKLLQDFKDIYANLSDPETLILSNNITSECSSVYRKKFSNFFKMSIQKFSNGSIAADSVLEFDSTNGSSAPNTSDVIDTLKAAISNGNFSFKVDNTSISATNILDNATGLAEYNITFKMNESFSNDLSNMTSAPAIKLATNVTTELNKFYKGFKNFNRSLVWRFRNGSIAVDALLGFVSGTNPTASELARGLAAAVRNGTVQLTIDPTSITVTDPSGQAANKSPVLASMLTALWMTLASLLLSAVMH